MGDPHAITSAADLRRLAARRPVELDGGAVLYVRDPTLAEADALANTGGDLAAVAATLAPLVVTADGAPIFADGAEALASLSTGQVEAITSAILSFADGLAAKKKRSTPNGPGTAGSRSNSARRRRNSRNG